MARGQFEKGQKKIEGSGRQAGSTNKVTRLMREMLRGAAEDNMDRFLEELDSLHGEKYVNAYLTMCKFILPTLQSVRVDDTNTAARSITEKLIALSEKNLKSDK